MLFEEIFLSTRKFLFKCFGDKLINEEELERDEENLALKMLENIRIERERRERERRERERQERERREREERERLEKERLEIINEKYDEIKNDLPDLFKLDKDKLIKLKNANNQQCIICLEDFKIGSQCLYLNCLHLFHSSCIVNWLLEHNNCPICKEDYKINANELENFLQNEYTNANNNTQSNHINNNSNQQSNNIPRNNNGNNNLNDVDCISIIIIVIMIIIYLNM